jgi:dihydrofolate synthase/folylpolyglutamate synthase
VRVDGEAIAPQAFEHGVQRMRGLVEQLARVHPEAGEPTTFEVTTALALDYVAGAGCTLAVVEVGLGGRLDATNALEPALSLITPISYDHTAILGTTLAAIATEKAGILRRGRPALLAEQRPAALRALRRMCRTVGAQCLVVPPLDRPVPQAGAHQRQNAALAIAAAHQLAAVSDVEIERGLSRLQWPGRFEVVGDVVLDGAHNGASAEALARTLQTFAAGRPIDLVLGINRDKDARAVLRPLLPLARTVWATQAADNPRALDAVRLAGWCRRLGKEARVAPRLPEALIAARGDGLVCVTGSLMLVGQMRTVLGLPVAERLWG